MASIALFGLICTIYTVKNLSIEEMIEKDVNKNDTKIVDTTEKIIKPIKIKIKKD
jgi:hypothetical protein